MPCCTAGPRKDRLTQALSHNALELARGLIGEIVKPTASGSLSFEPSHDLLEEATQLADGRTGN